MKTKNNTNTLKPQSRLSAMLGCEYGVRIKHHCHGFTDDFFYWRKNCCLEREDKFSRQRADRFATIELAIAAGEGIREWLKESYAIEYQVCYLPSWRVARKSMPNVEVSGCLPKDKQGNAC